MIDASVHVCKSEPMRSPYRALAPTAHVECYIVCVGAGLLNGAALSHRCRGQIGTAKNAGVRDLLHAKAFNHSAR